MYQYWCRYGRRAVPILSQQRENGCHVVWTVHVFLTRGHWSRPARLTKADVYPQLKMHCVAAADCISPPETKRGCSTTLLTLPPGGPLGARLSRGPRGLTVHAGVPSLTCHKRQAGKEWEKKTWFTKQAHYIPLVLYPVMQGRCVCWPRSFSYPFVPAPHWVQEAPGVRGTLAPWCNLRLLQTWQADTGQCRYLFHYNYLYNVIITFI